MSRKPMDLVGKTFNRLTAIERVPAPARAMCDTYKTSVWYLWQCSCGNKHVAPGFNVRHGTTKSCGCYRREMGNINWTKGQLKQQPPRYQAGERLKRGRIAFNRMDIEGFDDAE